MAGHITTYEGARGTTYRLVVDAGRGDDGKRRQVKRTLPKGTTRKQAEKALAKLVTDVDRQQANLVGNRMTLADLHDEWQRDRYPTFTPQTRRGYTRDWNRIPESLRATRLDRLEPRMIDKLYADLLRAGLAPSSVNHVGVLLSSMLTTAVRWGYLAPPHAVQRARAPRPNAVLPHRAPAPETVIKVLDEAAVHDPEQALYFRLCVVTGGRRSEVGALRWDSFHDDSAVIAEALTPDDNEWKRVLTKDTKTHAVRTVPLDDATVALLRTHRARCAQRALACGVSLLGDGFIFASEPDGSAPVHPDAWTKRWERLCARANVKGVRLHDLRHFVGTELADVLPLPVVMQQLGHARLSTTQRYAGAKASRSRDAANRMAAVIR
jgi:integrase